MTNYSESELIPFALKIIKENPSGLDTQNLIKKLRKEMKPNGEDTIILINRTDDKFSQKVRNLRSHKTLEKKNLATFKDNKFLITDKGLNYLSKTSGFLTQLINKSNLKKVEPLEEINLELLFNKLLSTLTPREENVIRRRFGIDHFPPETLDKIGKSFSVTRERIRQIETKALRKIKHPARFRIVRQIFYKIEEIIGSAIFLNEEEFFKKLENKNIKGNIKLSTLRFFLNIFGFNLWDKIHLIRGKYYVVESNYYLHSFLKTFNTYYKETAKDNSIININLLHKEIRRKNFSVSKKIIIDLINKKNGFLLDEEHFLATTKGESNRLIGVIKSTLSVTDKIDIDELSDCIKRSRRTDNYSPPNKTLETLCCKLGYEISESYILNKNYSENNSYLKGNYKKLYKMFLENGRIMSYEEILQQIDHFDLNENSTNVIIYENLFIQPRRMIFALAGTKVNEDLINTMDENRKNYIKKISENIKFSQDPTNGQILISFPKSISKHYLWISPDFHSLIPDGVYNFTIDNKKKELKIFNSKIWPIGLIRKSKEFEKFNTIILKLDILDKKAYIAHE